MDPADSFLDLPRCASERAGAWLRLVGGRKLYASLLRAVQERDVQRCEAVEARLARWGEECLAYPAGRAQLGSRALEQWEAARLLAWCAAWAARPAAEALRYTADRTWPAFVDAPQFVRDNATTACGWILTLRETPVLSWVKVPVALCHALDNNGLVADLELEVLDEMAGVFLHPEDALATRPGPEFAAALRDAWDAAAAAVPSECNPGRRCGRYRLRWRGLPVTEVDGRSAGGAAVRGWWHALQRLDPDEGVVVLARLEPNSDGRFRLAGVDGIANKVHAVIGELPWPDTLVVADPGDRQVALQCLNTPGRTGPIRVIDLGTAAGD